MPVRDVMIYLLTPLAWRRAGELENASHMDGVTRIFIDLIIRHIV